MFRLGCRRRLRWEVPDGRSGQVGSCAWFGDFASLASDEACGCEEVYVEDGDMQALGSMLGAMGIERWEKDDVEIGG